MNHRVNASNRLGPEPVPVVGFLNRETSHGFSILVYVYVYGWMVRGFVRCCGWLSGGLSNENATPTPGEKFSLSEFFFFRYGPTA